MTNGVIRVALERDVGKGSRHPHVERIMQKQIRQAGAYHPSLRSSRRARHDAAVLHLHRVLQPALDVEQHSRTVRMMTNRLERVVHAPRLSCKKAGQARIFTPNGELSGEIPIDKSPGTTLTIE